MDKYGSKHPTIQNSNSFSTEEKLEKNVAWKAVSKENEEDVEDLSFMYIGKNLQGSNHSGENLINANFSGSNLQEINLKGAKLNNADFTGADLSGADLSNADLSGADFTGAKLVGANLSGAKMHGVTLKNADLQDAILTDADLDNLSLAELQELVEFLAAYYPHKLNLSRLNLALLDLKRIDLSKVNLRGVDFTGCSFFGVNIFELDLSECIISPAQIEQALGHQPTPAEISKLLAPKRTKSKKSRGGFDIEEFFRGGKSRLDIDVTNYSVNAQKLLDSGKKIIREIKNSDTKQEEKINKNDNNEELRKSIEQYKREVMEQRKEQQAEPEKSVEQVREQIEETRMLINSHKQKGNER